MAGSSTSPSASMNPWTNMGTPYASLTGCELIGHRVESWVEYLDGECVGTCVACDCRVASRRTPGGMPFMRLKALAEIILANADDEMQILVEINEISDLLDREAEALEEARSLLAIAREMARCPE